MKLNDYEYRNIIDYLKMYTTYDLSELIKKPDEQLYRMKQNIEKAMTTYPKEILAYYETHPEHTPRFTLQELRSMKYNELSELRRSLKIRKGKKVTGTEEAPTLANKARQTIGEKTTGEMARDVIIANQQLEMELNPDYNFITLEEAFAMYGTDITDEFLREKGYMLYEPLNRTKENPEDQRYELIDAILESEISISNEPLSIEVLMQLNLEELLALNKIARMVTKKEEKPKSTKM